MQAISYSAFRTHLAKMLDQVNDDHVPMMITRQNGKPAVVMSVEDYNAYQETSYLLSSPENAKRLYKAKANLEAGKFTERELIEE